VEAVEYFFFRFLLLMKRHASEFASASSLLGFFAPLPAPDKVGHFRGRFRFQLILSNASASFRLLPLSVSAFSVF